MLTYTCRFAADAMLKNVVSMSREKAHKKIESIMITGFSFRQQIRPDGEKNKNLSRKPHFDASSSLSVPFRPSSHLEIYLQSHLDHSSEIIGHQTQR